MSYQIRYGENADRPDSPLPQGNSRKKFLILCAAVLCLLLFFGIGKQRLSEWLIPGDNEVTKQAFAGFTKDLEEGVSLGSAVEAFCREIIEGAEISESIR